MENKSGSNTSVLIVIALAVLLIVAMICGMGIWMMQRTMSFNERLLESRLAEDRAKQEDARTAQTAANGETLRVREALARAEAEAAEAKRQLELIRAQQTAEAKRPTLSAPAEKPVAQPASPKTETKPIRKPASKPTTALPERPKREAPKELPSATVGPDGRPKDRVILDLGAGETEWQL